MALNPFFLHGSPNEQRLVQELVNEQLRMYGVEVIYIPRKFVRKETIIKEISSSKFDDNFAIEAYLNNFDGYTGQGDILTKFGMNLRDEVSLIISKERFEDFIAPFLEQDDPEIEIFSRPREGDLVYFPLGQRIFEVKFVEHENPFYQLGKLYVYELKCELFEYEDEMGGWNDINTTVEEIDSTLENRGYITTLKLISSGRQAVSTANTATGYIRKIILTNDGYGYTSTPTIGISTAPVNGIDASAVAFTKCINGVCSVKEILLTNCGSGYTIAPEITINGVGVGAAATSILVTNYNGIRTVSIDDPGNGYPDSPTITFESPTVGLAITAIGKVLVNSEGQISQVLLSDAGIGYTQSHQAIISPPPVLTGIGTFIFNEVITGSISGASARVKSWDKDENILKVGTTKGQFKSGDVITGQTSSALYSLKEIRNAKFEDKYGDNDQIESEADSILDFSESNPFGTY